MGPGSGGAALGLAWLSVSARKRNAGEAGQVIGVQEAHSASNFAKKKRAWYGSMHSQQNEVSVESSLAQDKDDG
jgi:hypothetical protein